MIGEGRIDAERGRGEKKRDYEDDQIMGENTCQYV